MKEYFINYSNFPKFVLYLLRASKVIAPIKTGDNAFLEEITSKNMDSVDLYGFRTVESAKSVMFKVSEKVSRYFGDDEQTHEKALTILGMRGCDTEALEVTDRVFGEGDFRDEFYLANRAKVTIISADCTDCGDTCFCTRVNGHPYAVKLFDLNLSPIDGGYVVEAGTEKGRKLISENSGLFDQADGSIIAEKNKNRERITYLLDEKNRKFVYKHDLSDIHKRNLKNKVWRTLTKDCVECSGCNFICPTCTCFLLLDQAKAKDNERYKMWDACLKASYAKVAGGANPRGKLYERLQNRYHCKFDYSFDRLGRYTCVGCGRCINGCAGNIDMRKIFAELEKQAPLTVVLE